MVANFTFLLLLLFTPLEFFTSVLADAFSLEFEWQHVSSSLQDSSQDSGRSQQCSHLDSLYPSANFQLLLIFPADKTGPVEQYQKEMTGFKVINMEKKKTKQNKTKNSGCKNEFGLIGLVPLRHNNSLWVI